MIQIRVFVLLVAAMLSALCAPTFAQTCSVPSFTQAPIYPVGNDIRSVAAADFDSDGRPDLAVANTDASTVTVLLKVGRGEPATINTYAVGTFPLRVATGDFTGDGKPDIISLNNSTNISLLRNNGFGEFITAGTFNTFGAGVDMAVGDFNNNGTLDVAVAVGVGVSILLGNGQGAFSAPTLLQAPPTNTIIAADFNNDGKLDLAIAGSTATQILLGTATANLVILPAKCHSVRGWPPPTLTLTENLISL